VRWLVWTLYAAAENIEHVRQSIKWRLGAWSMDPQSMQSGWGGRAVGAAGGGSISRENKAWKAWRLLPAGVCPADTARPPTLITLPCTLPMLRPNQHICCRPPLLTGTCLGRAGGRGGAFAATEYSGPLHRGCALWRAALPARPAATALRPPGGAGGAFTPGTGWNTGLLRSSEFGQSAVISLFTTLYKEYLTENKCLVLTSIR
jgi:hypothetical protein